MCTMASLITGLSNVYSTICSGAVQRKHQSSASLAFVRGIHRSPVNSPHKGPVTQNVFNWWRNDAMNQCFRNYVCNYLLCSTYSWHVSTYPAGTRRNNNVFITSKRRRRRRLDVLKTLSLRHYCVMCPLGTLLYGLTTAVYHHDLDISF